MDFPALVQFLGLQKPSVTFGHNEVVRIARVESATLQNWVNRGLIEPFVSSPGKQGRRQYSGIDLATINIGSLLVKRGFQPGLAFLTANAAILDLIHAMRKPPLPDGIEDQIAIVRGDIADRHIQNMTTISRTDFRDLEGEIEPLLIIPTGALLLDLASRTRGS